VSNYLLMNPHAIPPESAVAISVTVAAFPPLDVRAAMASCAVSGPLSVDKILRVLADRLWREHELPPPVDVALGEIWNALWDGPRRKPWSHPAVAATVERFGWENLTGEAETTSVRRSQVRGMYESERERHVSEWIARVCLDAERRTPR